MTMPMTTSLSWNLLTKNLRGRELLHEKIRQKISKLEKYLVHFPPDTIHLQINLERHLKKDLFIAGLTLRLPSNILHTQKSAEDVITAFDDSVKALLRELESFKASLRRESAWKRKSRRQALHENKSTRFAPEPLPAGAGPQKPEDLLRDLLQQHYPRLVRHARRLIKHDEAQRQIPRDALDPSEVVDETVRRAIAQRPRKPPEMVWLVWFYRLIHDELRRERNDLKAQSQEQIMVEAPHEVPPELLAIRGQDTEQPGGDMEAISTGAPEASAIADSSMVSPDEEAARKDLLDELHHAIQGWPRLERDVFELYFVEGFEPDEIAMIVGEPLKKVEEVIANMQENLRQEVLRQALA
jgi:ribosomal subunit interface protein